MKPTGSCRSAAFRPLRRLPVGQQPGSRSGLKAALRQHLLPFLVLALALTLSPASPSRAAAVPHIELVKTPHGGIQPQAIADARGMVHLVYLAGDPKAADIFYVRRKPGQGAWSAPLRVNSRPGSAVAIGTIRGAQVALGKGGRLHVVWFGSDRALPAGNKPSGAPLLYSRLNDSRTEFEPQRNLMRQTRFLDGGPSVAADAAGHVFVTWHANDRSSEGEPARRLWIARSADEGLTFSGEEPAWPQPTGACACCSAKGFVDRSGRLLILYRAATGGTERDMVLLTSSDQGRKFRGGRLHPWKVNVCPMSSESFAESPGGVMAAWETRGQVHYTTLDARSRQPTRIIAAPGQAGDRKHPAIAANGDGAVLLAWTEGTGWERGGTLAWQLFTRSGTPVGATGRRAGAIPVWGLPTVVARRDGGFTLIY
jgi:hypothetical protein